MRSFICALLLVFLLAPAASAMPLHDDVERILQEEGLNGAVWATVTPDGTIEVDAVGSKDARTGEPLDADDRVHIGSVTKTLIAVGVLRLVSEGRLALDTPLSQLLPDLVFDNPWAATDPIRVRHLLDHTAGLDDARLWQVFSLEPSPDTPLAAAFSGDSTLLRVRTRPGSRFSYSNMGYGLAGMLIEAVTGERYEQYLDVHLLQPLGMHDSTFFFVSQVGSNPDPRLAMGHSDDGAAQAAVPIYLRSATQFTTTARDMAVFARFLMSDARLLGETFIDPALMSAMGRPVGTEAARAGLPAGYALGLARRDRYGALGKCHDGNTVGYRAMLCVFPEQQKAFFIAMNADSETADYGRFEALLTGALDVQAEASTRIGELPADIAAWEGIYVLAPNRFESFAWLDIMFSFARVSMDGGHLQLQPFRAKRRALISEGNRLLRATDRATTSHVLLISPDGIPVISDGFRSYERVFALKIVLLWISMAAGILGLLYIFIWGLVHVLKRRLAGSDTMFVPFTSVAALLLPVPFFLRQSFLQLGDATVASVALAVVTALLPGAMLVGLIAQLRRGVRGGAAVMSLAAMLAVLQWTIVLAAWGLVPLRLW